MSRPLTSEEFARIVECATERATDLVLQRLASRLGAKSSTTLADAIAGVLLEGVPRTAPEIAKSIHRRRSVVEDVLTSDARFVEVPPPPGRSRRARAWTLTPEGASESSRLVPGGRA